MSITRQGVEIATLLKESGEVQEYKRDDHGEARVDVEE